MNAKLALLVLVAFVGTTLVSTVRADKLSCPICKRLAALVKPNLDDPKAVEQIRQIIDQACAQAPPGEQDKCKSTLNGYVDLLHDLSPPEFCKKIGACTSDGLSRLIAGDSQELDIKQAFGQFLIDAMEPINEHLARGPSQQCAICQQVAKQVIETLKKDSVKKSIIDGVGKICAIASKDPAKVKECTQILTAYTEQLIKAIVEQDPAVICTILGQCQGLAQLEGKPLCDPCRASVGSVKKYLLDPNFKSELYKIVDKICDEELHQGQDCKNNLYPFVDKLIKGVEGIDEKEVCQKIHLC